jgi:RNA polymerase sigma-70 factor (ECF subfamily)
MSETATATLALPTPRRRTMDVEALYRSCADDLYAYARTVVRDPTLAEDVVAVAFERALARRGRFDDRRGSPRAWLFTIARNAAIDELRRGTKGATLTYDPVDERQPDPAELVVQRDERAARDASVAAAIASLPGRDRELVALKFHAGLSNAEIARVLELSPTNVGSRLHRILTRLREACHVEA